MKRKLILSATSCMILVSVACNKIIDIQQPRNTLTTDKIFATDAAANAALNGLYIQLMSSGLSFANSLITVTAGLSADEIKPGTSSAVPDEFVANALSASNAYASTIWSGAYARIYQCNGIIEGAQASTAISASLKSSLIATAKFNRALFYFYLIQLYGDVPLVLTTDYTKTASIGRTPVVQVYDQISSDLQEAQNSLSEDISSGRTIVSKYAAKALLARILLYRKDWGGAASFSNDVISSGKYKLNTDLKQVFLANSTEAIWQLAPTDGTGYTWEGNYFVAKANTIPSYPLQQTLTDSFEAGDKRKSDWVGSITVSGSTYNYPYKYRVFSGTGAATEYYMVLRLAEQYLIHAEAMANQGKLSDALSDIDKLRSRAGLPLYTTDGLQHSQSDILLLIEKERRHELFCEWGHRWLDLNRTGRTAAVLQQLKPALKSQSLLFPVPYTQLQANPQLTQNPGY